MLPFICFHLLTSIEGLHSFHWRLMMLPFICFHWRPTQLAEGSWCFHLIASTESLHSFHWRLKMLPFSCCHLFASICTIDVLPEFLLELGLLRWEGHRFSVRTSQCCVYIRRPSPMLHLHKRVHRCDCRTNSLAASSSQTDAAPLRANKNSHLLYAFITVALWVCSLLNISYGSTGHVLKHVTRKKTIENNKKYYKILYKYYQNHWKY